LRGHLKMPFMELLTLPLTLPKVKKYIIDSEEGHLPLNLHLTDP
jgi:hypothetical protein